MSFQSIFDDDANPSSNQLLWKKATPADQPDTDKSLIIFTGYLKKTEAGLTSMSDRFFVVTQDRLYYKNTESDEKYKAFMELNFVRVCAIEPQAEAQFYGLRFTLNNKFCDLFNKSKEEQETWMAALTPRVIRSDFHDRFKVRAQLGKGAFGKVYLATEPSGNNMAVKAMSKESITKQTRGKAALKNEISLLRSLNNANIMKLYEVHETTNSVYLVCELLPGGTLADYLRQQSDFLSLD